MDVIRISEIFGPTIQGEGALIGQPTVFVRTGGCDYRCSWCDTLHAVDSKYRAYWQPMEPQEIFARVDQLSGGKPIMVSLSGGNPAIQPLGELIKLGKSHGYSFALETQGSVAQDWFADLDILILSPKPPSSGMETNFDKLDECVAAAIPLPQSVAMGERLGEGVLPQESPSPRNSTHSATLRGEFLSSPPQARERNFPKIILKFVVFDDGDFEYARAVAARYPHLPVYLQPGNHTPPTDDKTYVDTNGIMARLRWLIEKTISDQWYAATVLPQLHVLIWGNQRGV